jgi:hypothetical protein
MQNFYPGRREAFTPSLRVLSIKSQKGAKMPDNQFENIITFFRYFWEEIHNGK